MGKEQQGDLIKQRAQYQVVAKCFLPDERLGISRMYDPNDPAWPQRRIDPNDPTAGTEPEPMLVFYDGAPGSCLKPHNQAAKSRWLEAHGKPFDQTVFGDPIRDLTIINNSSEKDLQEAMLKALGGMLAPILSGQKAA
jgi:hypothetical protein